MPAKSSALSIPPQGPSCNEVHYRNYAYDAPEHPVLHGLSCKNLHLGG